MIRNTAAVRRIAVVAVLLLGATAVPRPAAAVDDAVVTVVGTAYIAPATNISVGQGLDLLNQDVLPHNVTARDRRADGSPLFQSATIPRGVQTDVVGVNALSAGSYLFGCTLHPWMAGALNVSASADPPPVAPPTPGAVAVGGVVPTPTSVEVFGDRVYATSYAAGTVYEMEILEGGLLGPATEYATGFNSPLGHTFGPDGTLFVADSHGSERLDRATAGRVWALPPGGGAAGTVGQIVVDELPNGRHNTNGLAVHGGRLFITNGNSTDDGIEGGEPEEPLSGTLLSVALGARDLVLGGPNDPLPLGLTVHATGMRNVYDVAFRPGTDEAFVTTNGPDTQDPWGEDLLHKLDAASAGAVDFGFPECVYKPGAGGPTDPIWHQSFNPAVTGVCSDASHTAPEVTLGLHVSADGLAFGPEAGFGGDLYIATFGNFFGSSVVGHRVIRVPIDASGQAGEPVDYVLGVTPLDLTFGPAGTGMYVADFGASQILLVKPLL